MSRWKIDELSHQTGIPSRTIRFYQAKKVLPAPVRKGRVAYYDEVHRDRLHLIMAAQERGLQLTAIREVVDRLENGQDSLCSWLDIPRRPSPAIPLTLPSSWRAREFGKLLTLATADQAPAEMREGAA